MARGLATEAGLSLSAFALAVALHQPFTSMVLSGAATVDQLADNASAVGVVLDPPVVGQALAHAEPPEGYWASRSDLAWS